MADDMSQGVFLIRAAFTYLLRLLARIGAIGLLGMVLPGSASAQAMKDPTRPPAQYLGLSDPAQDATTPDSGLQSIKRTGKHALALLNGEWVRAGDKAGEAMVVKIGENTVVLDYPDGRRETIGMYPDVELKPIQAARRAARR